MLRWEMELFTIIRRHKADDYQTVIVWKGWGNSEDFAGTIADLWRMLWATVPWSSNLATEVITQIMYSEI